MTADEARALFDAAIDGELDPGTQRDFEQSLMRDDALRGEYEKQRALLAETRRLAQASPKVDLLQGVQEKLRARSGGRFYRDEFAQRVGRSRTVVSMMVLSAVVLIACLALVAIYVFGV
jgi:anti-sigma factor RsiW